MSGLQINGLDTVDRCFKKALKNMPEKRLELHEDISRMLKNTLMGEIGTRLDDHNGHVSAWQIPHVGSKGGYAAIRPTNASSGSNSPGAITNYLEHGHRIRRGDGVAKRKRDNRVQKAYVDGYHFYEAAGEGMEKVVNRMIAEFANELVKELGG